MSAIWVQGSGFRMQKGLFVCLAWLLLATMAPATTETGTKYERTFADAARAYDENRLADAMAGWQSLVDAGQALPEVLFNLGNACYRNGELGKAIRAYRHAQTLSPRAPPPPRWR